MIQAKARYLGGHPAAAAGSKRCVITVDEHALRCDYPPLEVPLLDVVRAEMTATTDRLRNFRVSPTAGLFGGLKENAPNAANRVDAAMKREVRIVIRDRHGDEHVVRFTKVLMQGLSRADRRAAARNDEFGSGERFIREILAARLRAKTTGSP